MYCGEKKVLGRMKPGLHSEQMNNTEGVWKLVGEWRGNNICRKDADPGNVHLTHRLCRDKRQTLFYLLLQEPF